MTLVSDNYRPDRVLEVRRNRLRFVQKFIEIFRFFFSILLILLILSISTCQRFRKGPLDQNECMGCIMEDFEYLNFIETDSNPHKNSWIYSGFSFPFC